jgi:hypothetical protein
MRTSIFRSAAITLSFAAIFRIAGHNFRSAMRDDCAGHAFFLAPCQLRSNRRVTDQCLAAFANKRLRDRGTVANVNLDILQCCGAFVNKDEIRYVENARAPASHTVSDRRNRARRVRYMHRKKRGRNYSITRSKIAMWSKNVRRQKFAALLLKRSRLNIPSFRRIPRRDPDGRG